MRAPRKSDNDRLSFVLLASLGIAIASIIVGANVFIAMESDVGGTPDKEIETVIESLGGKTYWKKNETLLVKIAKSKNQVIHRVEFSIESVDPNYSDKVISVLLRCRHLESIALSGGMMETLAPPAPGKYRVDMTELKKKLPGKETYLLID